MGGCRSHVTLVCIEEGYVIAVCWRAPGCQQKPVNFSQSHAGSPGINPPMLSTWQSVRGSRLRLYRSRVWTKQMAVVTLFEYQLAHCGSSSFELSVFSNHSNISLWWWFGKKGCNWHTSFCTKSLFILLRWKTNCSFTQRWLCYRNRHRNFFHLNCSIVSLFRCDTRNELEILHLAAWGKLLLYSFRVLAGQCLMERILCHIINNSLTGVAGVIYCSTTSEA